MYSRIMMKLKNKVNRIRKTIVEKYENKIKGYLEEKEKEDICLEEESFDEKIKEEKQQEEELDGKKLYFHLVEVFCPSCVCRAECGQYEVL